MGEEIPNDGGQQAYTCANIDLNHQTKLSKENR